MSFGIVEVMWVFVNRNGNERRPTCAVMLATPRWFDTPCKESYSPSEYENISGIRETKVWIPILWKEGGGKEEEYGCYELVFIYLLISIPVYFSCLFTRSFSCSFADFYFIIYLCVFNYLFTSLFMNLFNYLSLYMYLFTYLFMQLFLFDRLCGLVVRVSGYRSRGPGFDSRPYQIFWEVGCLEGGPLSLVRTIEELLEWKSSGSGLEKRD
jgi:hypothetical protein